MKKSNIEQPEFELHVAAEAGQFSGAFRDSLIVLEFRDDGLVGQGVVYPPGTDLALKTCPLTGLHMTWDSFDRDEYVAKRDSFDETWAEFADEVVGYAHGEVIQPEWDLEVTPKPFDSSIEWPLRRFIPDLTTERKKWDIHISADREELAGELTEILLDEAGMYYIDIRKRTGRMRRVFTIQGINDLSEGLGAFEAMYEYLVAAGGMGGSIKLEQTTFWRLAGNPGIVPPVVNTSPLKRLAATLP